MSVIVDDRDPLVEYSPQGGWGTPNGRGGSSAEYQRTTTRSTQKGDTATFKFEGTGVAVYGTIGSGSSSINEGASMTFSIDGASPTPYTAPVVTQNTPLFHQSLWTSGPLAEGSHTLTMTVGPNQQSIIYLDYLMYNTTSTAGKTVFIDDADPDIIYSLDWKGVDPKFIPVYFQHTGRVTPSSSSSISLSFEGTFVSLNGVIFGKPENLNGSVAIDGGEALTITPPPTPDSKSHVRLNYPLFSKSDLAPGSHNMTVFITNGQSFAVDYLLTGTEPMAPPKTSNTSSEPPPTSTSSDSLLQASSTSSSTHVTAGVSSSDHISLAALIGCVLGGVAVLLLMIFSGVFIWRRRARRFNAERSDRISVTSPWRERRESVATMVTLQDAEAQINTEYRKSQLTPRYLAY
ncbi:hypothetical protein C8R43DRAFT_1058086 [Mycena crocata]|nr:hypothetical protein C8R43DRAFT_1058086 [Mycena crocata]